VIAFYGGSAFNDDQFEPTDASLIDVRLPAGGTTFYVEVDTFPSAILGDVDEGAYELLIYRFDAWNANDVGDQLEGAGGDDVLKGGLGNDSLDGGAGNDSLDGDVGNDAYFLAAGGNDVVFDAAGRDTLNFAAKTLGISIHLGLATGQVQVIDTAGNQLAINGVVEIVVATAFADNVTGNDADNVVFAGDGADTVFGGLGNDVLLGGADADTLQGDDGRDLLIGGLAADVLKGMGGDDVLIGSITTFDSNQSALDALMAEWTSTNTYAQRVAYLTGTSGGANGTTYLIKNVTVLDDNKVKDTYFGGLDSDLFFLFPGEKAEDKEGGETLF
jgi:Ca2+-binding RTX toxin-like protein